MEFIQLTLYLYYLCDALLLLFGIPKIFEWIKFPRFLEELFQYGKTRGDQNVQSVVVRVIEIPKSWFKHFYAYGLVVSAYMTFLSISCYYLGQQITGADFVIGLLGTNREITTDSLAATIVCVCMLIQHFRRLYESLCVSVYSKGTMNILHYLLGVLLYSTVQLYALAEAPSLEKANPTTISLSMDSLRLHWNKLFGIVLFAWASYEHYHSHVILANLRKDRSGKQVIHRQHVIPRGGLFKYLSTPHFFCEILLYIAMGIILWGNCKFWAGIVLFVLINQGLMALTTHKWYQESFDDYPKERKSLIPFIY